MPLNIWDLTSIEKQKKLEYAELRNAQATSSAYFWCPS